MGLAWALWQKSEAGIRGERGQRQPRELGPGSISLHADMFWPKSQRSENCQVKSGFLEQENKTCSVYQFDALIYNIYIYYM